MKKITEKTLEAYLGILYFNMRVLDMAEDESNPLLERLNFAYIGSSNIDEFYETKISFLRKQSDRRELDTSMPERIIVMIHKINNLLHELHKKKEKIIIDHIIPSLREENIKILEKKQWTRSQKEWVHNFFVSEILPVLSPMALDPSHPFPRISNKNLNFIVSIQGKDAFGREGNLAIVHVPRILPRWILLKSDRNDIQCVYLSSVIRAFIHEIFPGMEVLGAYEFRLTRDSDLTIDEEHIADLASAVRMRLFDRRYGQSLRLEISQECPDHLVQFLLDQHQLKKEDVFLAKLPVNLNRYQDLIFSIDRPDLKFDKHRPKIPGWMRRHADLFEAISIHDRLLHHPYHSFDIILEWIRVASHDPKVLSIQITLYRTGPQSEIVGALIDAAKLGKEVTAVIEVRARFDEADNIELASKLHQAGAKVVYGVVGYKTHAKMMLVLRKEEKGIKRYVHLSTGNYHAKTSKLYTDFSLMSAREDLGMDVQKIFLQLTGICKQAHYQSLVIAPFDLRDHLERNIQSEMNEAKQGRLAKIMLKANALTDEDLALIVYQAAQAGVEIDLWIRGACILRPAKFSSGGSIRIRSNLGRFLEHSRIYYFYRSGREDIYLSSADIMYRNLSHRVEVCFPIQDAVLKQRVIEQGFRVHQESERFVWEMQDDGTYQKLWSEADQPSAQEMLRQMMVD